MKTVLLTLAALVAAVAVASSADGNRLAYLESEDPFYPHLGLARLTTPQWIGEEGVEAVVILSIDDLRQPQKYEDYLRPILERLKQIDGRAPFSIFCNQFDPGEKRFPEWLAEGVSLEVHTLAHPCPLLGKMDFDAAWQTVFGGLDLLAKIPGNTPRVFRMPCCDSMNSASPRFFSEILPGLSADGRMFAADSSVGCLLTLADTSLPRELVTDPDGSERFRKYFPMEMVPPRKLTFERFGAFIEDYPYPYVVGRGVWEFPFVVPSDWAAFNTHGAKNPRTTEDWKAALDAIVLKQGVMTLVLHPHGWSDPAQLVALIDHAVEKYGRRVKFLNFPEAIALLERNALGGVTLRDPKSGMYQNWSGAPPRDPTTKALRARVDRDNGVRLLDLNHDGFMDVVIGNERLQKTRLWNPKTRYWEEEGLPVQITNLAIGGGRIDSQVRFGVLREGGGASMLSPLVWSGGWHFENGKWVEAPLLKGIDREMARGEFDAGVRLHDFDGDGICELLCSNAAGTAIYRWSEKPQRWEKAELAWPEGVSLVNERGEDNGLRFVDLNGDGCGDLLISNEHVSAIHLWAKHVNPGLGWKAGWSVVAQAAGPRDQESQAGGLRYVPPIVRAGPQRSNGAWFKAGRMFLQNEDTAKLDGVVDVRTFQELIAFDTPPPKSPEDSLAAIKVRAGFTVELVASEPLVVDPIAFEWDARGRLWVVEMRDYPLGMDGKGKPGGVIKVLEDADGDGRYDKATAFLEGLPYPTGVQPWRKGVLVAAAPDLFYAEDTDGDGHADLRKLLFTGFSEGNQQHRLNGFELDLDGWIYCANGDSGGEVKSLATGKLVNIRGRDFRFRPETGEFEAIEGQTQYGRRCDDWGNWFGNANPTWLWHYPIPERDLARNPQLAVKSLKQVLANYPEPTRVFPVSTPLVRFNQPQSLNHVTSACSATPYRDDLFGPDFATSVFICEPVHNVVHREVLVADGVSFASRRADDERESEFLASADHWFRPTMLKTGPDGALYIADMYRFVLEHPQWIAPETQARLDLRAGEDKGRIYRVFPEKNPPRAIPDLTKLDPAGLVAALDSPSGWQRTTAQRLLIERADRAVAPALAALAKDAMSPKTRLHALWTLKGTGVLDSAMAVAALRDAHPAVRESAVQLATGALEALAPLTDDPEIRVRYRLALELGNSALPEGGQLLAKIALRDGGDPFVRTAVLSSAGPHLRTLLEVLLSASVAPDAELLSGLARTAAVVPNRAALSSALSRLYDPNSKLETWRLRAVAGLLDAGGADTLAKAQPLIAAARKLFDPESATRDSGLTLAALSLMGRDGDSDAAEIVPLLAPQVPAEVQSAAATALARMPEGKGSRVLLAGWGSYAPSLRVEVLRLMLARAASGQDLLAAIEAGKIAAGEIDAASREALLKHKNEGIRDRATKVFSQTRSDRQKLVGEYLGGMPGVGERERGAAIFRAQCALCHRLRGEGTDVGPDLGMVAGKPLEELLAAILDPNRSIEARYLAYTAATKDGRAFAGLLATESANAIVLKAPGGLEETILRAEVKELTATGRSLMPEGLENALTKEQMADLLRFLRGP
jgi:putative membrane-bound dehydrogenase-like protein